MEPRAQALTVFPPYYIEKKYQSKMVLKFCILVLLGGSLFCVSMYTSMDRDMGYGYSRALEGLRYLKGNMVKDFLLNETGIVLFLLFAVFIMTLVMSHRIAGPLWRIEQTARAVGGGDLTVEVCLRKTDEIMPLADQMNRMTRGLRWRVRDINTAYKVLDTGITRLRERAATGELTPDQSVAVMREVLDASKTLLGKLEQIKTR